MQKLVLDESTTEKLQQAASHVELCNESGQTIGYYLPAENKDTSLYQWARTVISDDELDRRRAERSEGRPLREILEKLDGK